MLPVSKPAFRKWPAVQVNKWQKLGSRQGPPDRRNWVGVL